MWWGRTQVQSPAEVLALKASVLEENVSRAGAALGCSYANSREYEAELIAARRAAGIYGPKSHPWKMRVAAIAAGLAVVIVLIVLIT
jgi:hypothetical protein